MFQPWRLSPTIEHSATEEPTAQLTFAPNTSTTASTPSATTIGVDDFAIGAPAADRSKYEKLGTNDITSDDDDDDNSGAELCHEVVSANSTLAARKLQFKQIVAHNLHGKMQAVYGKVDKTQVKVVSPIVRKIRLKADQYSTGKSSQSHKDSESKKATKMRKSSSKAHDGTHSADKESDNDSIGSASDLQKTEENASEAAHGSATKTHVSHARRSPKKLGDDAMSESVRTCGSSAYHAECESVATNEDIKSRVQIRMRVKKRDRQSDGTDAKDETMVSPLSAEFLHQFGDRPLLLDDELEYDSSDPTTESKVEEEPSEVVLTDAEELDVFARAPFKMPETIERFRHRNPIENASQPISDPFNHTTARPLDQYFSPVRGGPEACSSNPFLLPESAVELPRISQPVSDPPVESAFAAPLHRAENQIWNDVHLTPVPEPSNVFVVTVNEPSVVDTPASEQLRTSPHKFVNFSQISVDTTSVTPDVASSNFGFVHLQDNAFGEMSSPGSDYSVINRAAMVTNRPGKNKRDKTSSKYTPLKDDKPRATKSNSTLVALPAILTSKVKGSTPSYKKVSPILQTNQQPGASVASPSASTAPGTVQHEYQIGFNNMSFEDFPSDQELDQPCRSDGATCKQSTPFEVVRNERMLVEAERKFGSLKRRSNLFSS